MLSYRKIAYCLFLGLVVPQVWAKVEMPAIFGDNMVLQRQKPINVWGKAAPLASVDVEFAGRKASAKADAKGRWSATLLPLEASSSAKDFVVRENGKSALRFSNVLVGEVWILGGQQNMSAPIADAFKNKAEASSGNPLARHIKLSGASALPSSAVKASNAWAALNAESAKWISTVGAAFGNELSAKLKVPVGLIDVSESESFMRAWIAESDFKSDKYLQRVLAEWKRDMENYDFKKAEANYAKVSKSEKHAPGAPSPETCWPDGKTPARLYNGRIAPIGPLFARGILWYQGESDASESESSKNFEGQFKIMTESWRRAMKDDSLFFLCVQLPSMDSKSDLSDIRWRQYLSAESLPYVSIVNSIDLGAASGPSAKDRLEIGQRLSSAALSKVYGWKAERGALFPRTSHVVYKDDCADVHFKLFGKKLNGRGTPRGFEVKSGAEWIPAKAELRGNIVVLRAAVPGKKIDGVRYLWKNSAAADAWLFNEDGLPAFPFANLK